jgi:hypothetical protein
VRLTAAGPLLFDPIWLETSGVCVTLVEHTLAPVPTAIAAVVPCRVRTIRDLSAVFHGPRYLSIIDKKASRYVSQLASCQ